MLIAAIFFFACNQQIIYAQTKSNMQWGFTMDAYFLSEQQNFRSANEFFMSPLFHLFAGYEFNKYFQADFNAGYLVFASNWDEPDIGIDLKYKPVSKIFISVGWSYEHVAGANNLPGNLPPIFSSRDFNFFNIGGGLFLTKFLFFQVIYSRTLNKDLTYGQSSPAYPGEPLAFFKLKSKLKFSFGFDFPI